MVVSKKIKDCRKKVTYESLADAEKDIQKYIRLNKMIFRAYQCDICSKYHLTKLPAR